MDKVKIALSIAAITLVIVGCTNDTKDIVAIESQSTQEMQTDSEAYKKGKELSDQITDEMESVDWEENYQKAEQAGEDLANYLNGLLGGN